MMERTWSTIFAEEFCKEPRTEQQPIDMMQGEPQLQYPQVQNQQPIGMMQGEPQLQYPQVQNPQMQQQMQQVLYPHGLPGEPTPGGGPSTGQPGVPQGSYFGGLQQPVAYQHLQQQEQQIKKFWRAQMQDMEQVNDFKTHQLPLARIKKIMKSDEEVKLISAEAPVLFAKACVMFIRELTLESSNYTEENKRRTLQKNDIAAVRKRNCKFDFLVDIFTRDELKDKGTLREIAPAALPVGQPADALPHGGMYYGATGQPQQGVPPAMQQQQANTMGSATMMGGRPGMPMDLSMYANQVRPPNMQYMPQHGMQPMQQLWSQPNPYPWAPINS